MPDHDLRERVAVLEARQESLERLIERVANSVLQQQAEANADRKAQERVLVVVERQARASEEIAAQLVTYLPRIDLRAGDAAADARRAADATGRVLLSPPVEKSGPVKALVGVVDRIVRAPATKILALAALVVALAVAVGAGIAVYQEVRALKARLGGP